MAAGEPDAMTRVPRPRLLTSAAPAIRADVFGERLGEDAGSRGRRRARTVPGSLWAHSRPACSRQRLGGRRRPRPVDPSAVVSITVCTVAALQCQAAAHILEASSRPKPRQYAAASPGTTGSRVLGGTSWQHVAREAPVPCRTNFESRMHPWNAQGTSCNAPVCGASTRPTAEVRSAKSVGTENG